MLHVLTAAVYHVWQARNEAFWHSKVRRIECTVNNVKNTIKHRTHFCFATNGVLEIVSGKKTCKVV